MHSFLARLNALFAFTLTLVGALAFGLYLSSFVYSTTGKITLGTNKLAVKHMTEFSNGRKKNDLGFLNFDLEADLEYLFNWNVKELFLYLTAEYETNNNKLNQVVIWDKIVMKGDNYKLNMRGSKAKYYFWDDGPNLLGHQNITLYLNWNVVPNVGSLPNVAVDGSHKFAFPAQYARNI